MTNNTNTDHIVIPNSLVKISRKRLLMQYLRWLPYQLGFINKAAFLHQIKTIHLTDTFLVSYPKSGNTWLRFIIAYLKNGTDQVLSENEVNKIVPDVYIDKDIIDLQTGNRIIKSHDVFLEYYPKIIYVYRDYRDVVISYYHFCLSLNFFEGTLSEFIKSPIVERHGNWAQHLNKALAYKNEYPENILLIKYEDLKENFAVEIDKLAGFLNVKSFDRDKIKDLTSFDKLRDTENKNGTRFKNATGRNFFRQGKSKTWKEDLSKEDLDFIYNNEKIFYFLKLLKYVE